MNDEDYMEIALNEAKQTFDKGNYPAGCVIVKSGEIISKTQGSNITSKDSTAHGEIKAIHLACKKLGSRHLEGCVIYSNAEPCLMCAQAIIYARIKLVVYGIEHGEYGKRKTFDILKENNIGKDIEVVGGVKREEAEKLLKDFLKKVSVKEF